MKLLIVDDEPFTSDGLYNLIKDSGLAFDEVRVTGSGEKAAAMLHEYSPEVVLSDIRMPGMNGLELAKIIKTMYPQCQIIFMSGFNDREYIKGALDIRAMAFIDKPIDEDELIEKLERAIKASVQIKRDINAVRSFVNGETARRVMENALAEDIPHTIKMTRKYINDNFNNPILTINDIAKHVHTSAGHLSAVFKNHTKHTLLQYITHCRMEFAKKQLVDTNNKIMDIARETGYRDSYYFSKVFQRETGMTPQKYRITMYTANG
jgi:YesN/AraC family two-component response regulator